MAMHSLDPSHVQPFLVFAVVIATGLLGIHFIKRLNWYLVLAAVAFPAQPFFGNLFLFMDSVCRRTVDYPLLHKLMGFIHGYSFWAAAVCMLLWIVGLVGGTGACIREYRKDRREKTEGRK